MKPYKKIRDFTPSELNEEVGDILSQPNPFAATFKMAQQNERNIDRIYEGIKNNITFPAPIIIRKGSSLYLMGGNTRMCAFAAINMSISVKVLEYR